MACLCGSSKCDCEEECFCPEALCGCPMCKALPKMCPHCSLPFYDSSKEYACQVCSCGKQGDSSYSEAMSDSPTTESETSCDSKVPVCCRCKLPIFLVDTGDEDEHKHKGSFCRCPQNLTANEPIQSEHETSSTSDHRQVSADRQVRKALSRKTRTEKSNWQAKKAKDRSSNSPEKSGNNTEIVSAGTLLTDISSSHLAGHDSSYSACATYASNMDINPDFNSPQKLRSRTDETTGNISLLVNISGVSSQCTPEASSFQTSGYKQANIPVEVPPFPLLPNPIPAPPGFERQQYPSPSFNLDNAPQPILPEQVPVERTERMEKWFGTIQDVLNTSGELPDAETAAALDKLDKGRLDKQKLGKGKPNKGKPVVDDSDEFPNYGSIPSPKGKRKVKSDTEQHTDTDRSTSVSQYRMESDRMESESD